jgi:hypothetical protein
MGKTSSMMYQEVVDLQHRIKREAPQLSWLIDEVRDDMDILIGCWLDCRCRKGD